MRKVYIPNPANSEEKVQALHTSFALGFFSTSAQFPITTDNFEDPLRIELQEISTLYCSKDPVWPQDYISSTKSAQAISSMDWRRKKGIESLFSAGDFLKDENFDQLPDALNFRFLLPEKSSPSVLHAACNLAFRFGMETTAFEGSLLATDAWKGNLIQFEEAERCEMALVQRDGRLVLLIQGQGQELVDFMCNFCENFPLLPEGRTWVRQLQDMTDSFAMRHLDGELVYLHAYGRDLDQPVQAFLSPESEERMDQLQEFFPNVEFANYKAKRKIYEHVYDLPWEVDEFKKILEEKVYPFIQAKDTVELYGALSEDREVRHALLNEIREELGRRQANPAKLQLICSYKQGFSWLEEVVLPQIIDKNVEKIEIAFRPFLPEGESQWIDESGAVPTYNLSAADPEKWLDLPIRYLQELYPIDDLLADALSISKEQIIFLPYKGDEDITYEVTVTASDEIHSYHYLAANNERPYLDDFLNLGKVHPATGYLKVFVNGALLLDTRIPSDLENIWNLYQSQVLPECKAYVDAKTKPAPDASMQPFFAQLRLDIEASEPDYRLPFREDMVSSLNALHEDLYFVGSDYFKHYGLKASGTPFDAPGLILPVIKKSKGKPFFKATLYDQAAQTPLIQGRGQIIKPVVDRREIECFIQKISYGEGQMTLGIQTNVKDPALLKSYAELFESGILEASRLMDRADFIQFLSPKIVPFAIQKPPAVLKDLRISEIDLHESRLIGYEAYLEIISQLRRVPGIDVYQVGTSYLGRKIYAIEILPKESGYVSRTKRITRLPSEIINARHHANEVSGTNAALILLKKILTEPRYRDLPDKLNLVLMPMENVDGTDIHNQLQKDNPYWKLHVARFNAIGKEFYYEHFNPDTIHTEALALTRLWEKFLPDVIVDNHGVPSHEWEQQFSGYTSPSFKGFWLPRSLLYGYFWVVTDAEYAGNYKLNKKMEDAIADRISQDAEITRWNKTWIPIFEKYAHQWLPKLFPAEYYKDMINYWIPFAFDALHRYPSIRFPWITSVAYTSEVADETAQGDYLNLCARTHVAHDEAVLEMLMNASSVFETQYALAPDTLALKCIRHRPLI